MPEILSHDYLYTGLFLYPRNAVNIKKAILKACVRDFLFFHQMIVFYFHLKSSFRSRDNQIFVLPGSALFLPVAHCFIG